MVQKQTRTNRPSSSQLIEFQQAMKGSEILSSQLFGKMRESMDNIRNKLKLQSFYAEYEIRKNKIKIRR